MEEVMMDWGMGVAGEAVDGGLDRVEGGSSSHEQVETEKY